KEKTCEPDIETQTADTMKLHAVDEATNAKFESSSMHNQSIMLEQVMNESERSFLDFDGAESGLMSDTMNDFVLDLGDDSAFAVPARAPFVQPSVEVVEEVVEEVVAEPQDIPSQGAIA